MIMSSAITSIFISYSKITKSDAMIIKNHLLGLSNYNVFIAPDDVPIGSPDYLSEIYAKIKTCNVFLSLIHDTSYKTYFADHECGIAIALEKTILPICIDDTPPYGFLRDYHGVCCKEDGVEAKLNEIENFILSATYRDKDYVELIVSALCNSTSFSNATHWARKLRVCEIIPEEQIQLLKEAFKNNDQIYCSYAARPIVYKIIVDYTGLTP